MDQHFLRARVAAGGVLAAVCVVAAAAAVGGDGTAERQPLLAMGTAAQAEPSTLGTLPVVAEHRYRIAAKIRPLLLFWVGKDDVGGARIRWRKGENDARGYDALIGSDPARAPRKINRWGFILEEAGPSGATVVGIMKKSDEESLDEAKSRVAAEAKGSVVFKMIQATVSQTESVSRLTVSTVPRDYSYRELGAIVEVLSKETAPPKILKTPVPPGGRAGMLTAIIELLRDGVESVKRTGKAPGRKGLGYAYYAKQYDVTRVSAAVERNAAYGGVTYPKLLRSEFEVRARKESWAESFTIVCGFDGPLAEIPVFLTYQPRWWFKVEMVLDERQVF
jgi:hypothetical protein